MNIKNDHLYHGAALTQIAEHPQFTAINAFKLTNGISRSAFSVNNNIGVYLKYATEPKGQFDEYTFTFTTSNLDEIKELETKFDKVYTALVCVKDREICCLPTTDLNRMVAARKAAKKATESQYVIIARLQKAGRFRVYTVPPGVKKQILGKETMIARKDFPNVLFD